MEYSLRCLSCGSVFPYSSKQVCPKCGGILEVEYKDNAHADFPSKPKSFWSFESLMPNGKYRHFELGMTKLIESTEPGLYLKLEFENPTRSFKDRGSAIEVAKAKEYGYDKIVCASTGNMAYSISYYAALYGLDAVVFISRGANKDKLFDIRQTHDAELHLINGDFTAAQAYAEEYAEKNRAFLAGDYCYRKEGQSTIGFELAAQAQDLSNIIMPIGNGTLFSGVYKAYERMKEMRNSKVKIPRLIGVQADGCAPVAKAFKEGVEVKYAKPATAADAIAVGYPSYGMQVLRAVKDTNGTIVTVSDKAMRIEQERFYNEYGIKVELAAVASIAAYRKLARKLKGKTAALITGANL